MIKTDESNIAEIELLPDGRIYAFGMSLELLEVLDAIQHGTDLSIRRRLDVNENAPAKIARAFRIQKG